VLEIELPGIKPSDVEVTAENGILTIRGEKQGTSTEGTEGRYHVVERTYGSFTRSFQLPSAIDERSIDAEFEDGLLSVHIPKAAIAQPRKIEIRNSGSQPAIRGGGSQGSGAQSGSGTQGSAPQTQSGSRGRKSSSASDDSAASNPESGDTGNAGASTNSRTGS